jgi:hypothetical protein
LRKGAQRRADHEVHMTGQKDVEHICPECDGTGQERGMHPVRLGETNEFRACTKCGGSGKIEIAIEPKPRADASFPVVDVKVTPIDGARHDLDCSALAFKIAASEAFREALHRAGSVVLEPIMKVEVVTPEDCTGAVIGDLNSRRGQIQGQDRRGNANVIKAMVPLITMSGFANSLRSMSWGRAVFTMRFDHYAAMPAPPSTN